MKDAKSPTYFLSFLVTLVTLGIWILGSSILASAQRAGNNAVYNSGGTIVGSPAFVDAAGYNVGIG